METTETETGPGDAPEVRLLLSTAPPGKARKLAGALVEERLAACVNLLPGARSVYRWKNDVLDEPETLLLIKTTLALVDTVRSRLGELHPYEVPEMLVFAPESGLSAYLAWVAAETDGP